MNYELISLLGSAQNGVITRKQLLSIGIKPTTLDRLISKGNFRKVGSGIYLMAGSIPTWEQKATIAVFNGGKNALLSHESVLQLYGIIDFSRDTYYRKRRPEYTRHLLHVLNPRKEYRDKDFFFHRTKKLLTFDANNIFHGIAHVSLERAIVDCNQQLTNHELSYALDRMRSLELIDRNRMFTAINLLHPGPGREKVRLKNAVALLFDDYQNIAVDSYAEKRVEDIIKSLTNYKIYRQYDVLLSSGHCKIDLAIPDLRIAIEVQSHQFHKYRNKFDSDLKRIADLHMLGWQAFQFSTSMTDAQIAEYFKHILSMANAQ
jgi:very-short-patch-repair endonuclease